MNIVNGDESYPATPENSFFFQSDNDLLDGFYIDLDESYIFISKHTPEYRLIEKPGQEEGILNIYEEGFEPTEEPLLYIVSALGRVIVRGAEQMCENPDVEPLNLVKEELPEPKTGVESEFIRLSNLVQDPDVGSWLKSQYWKEIDKLLDGRNERTQ